MPHPKTLLDRLDAVAESTGIPRLVTGSPRRRHLRWLPLIPLGMATGALAAALGWSNGSMVAAPLMTVAVALSSLLPLAGPLKPWGTAERVDEFDRAARGRAYFATFATISVTAFMGLLLLFGLMLLSAWPREAVLIALVMFALYLLVLFETLPTLHASWSVRPIDEEG